MEKSVHAIIRQLGTHYSGLREASGAEPVGKGFGNANYLVASAGEPNLMLGE